MASLFRCSHLDLGINEYDLVAQSLSFLLGKLDFLQFPWLEFMRSIMLHVLQGCFPVKKQAGSNVDLEGHYYTFLPNSIPVRNQPHGLESQKI